MHDTELQLVAAARPGHFGLRGAPFVAEVQLAGEHLLLLRVLQRKEERTNDY
jgi:hypothetical protein